MWRHILFLNKHRKHMIAFKCNQEYVFINLQFIIDQSLWPLQDSFAASLQDVSAHLQKQIVNVTWIFIIGFVSISTMNPLALLTFISIVSAGGISPFSDADLFSIHWAGNGDLETLKNVWTIIIYNYNDTHMFFLWFLGDQHFLPLICTGPFWNIIQIQSVVVEKTCRNQYSILSQIMCKSWIWLITSQW